MSTLGRESSARHERPPLSDREHRILRLVVRNFIDTAGPVGSRTLAKAFDLELSPASIRNTMADLEDMGYLDHPYTSAGRMPTELGYRTYVDELMERPELSDEERAMLKAQLARLISDTDELLREGTRLLGKLTNLLGVALSPRLSSGVLERLDIVPVSSSRLLFVLSIEEGPVKTIVLGFEADVPRAEIDRVVSMLNERLTGLTLAEIRDTCEARLRTIEDSTGIVRLVVDRARPLFGEPKATRLRVGGTQNILNQPEFQEPDEVRRLIQLIEDEDSVVELIENLSDASTDAIGQAFVSIGSESSADAADWLSIITSPYRLGETTGTLGVIGPTRMDYPRAVALVENMAAVLNDPSGRPDAATGSSAAQLSA